MPFASYILFSRLLLYLHRRFKFSSNIVQRISDYFAKRQYEFSFRSGRFLNRLSDSACAFKIISVRNFRKKTPGRDSLFFQKSFPTFFSKSFFLPRRIFYFFAKYIFITLSNAVFCDISNFIVSGKTCMPIIIKTSYIAFYCIVFYLNSTFSNRYFCFTSGYFSRSTSLINIP